MESIWSFLLQTLTVSLTAAVLLLLKYLLQDKLSPRWQYGVWGILALRILVPAVATRQVLLPLPMWVEQMKSAVEAGLSSAYSGPYTPVAVGHVLPWVTGRPVSVTDWLFVIYAAGVAVSILWYLFAYLRLRLLLRRGAPVSAAVTEQIARVAGQYGLKPCRAVAVPGLDTAFVCGLFRPVLAVPADAFPDDKVLLHELLHLRYRDGLQNFLWCLLRSLHWCNPFLHWVFRRIGNDMESLCDQRVLERLEGEDRREYGVMLLSAASRRYARAPGTTSISNGGRQIARRIEAIARFKRYPAGMGLVSVCIALVLIIPTVWGMELSFDFQDFRPGPLSELPRAMAASRIHRCTTPGGALDTYAKGLLLENGVYIAAASPLSKQAELEASMRRSVEEEGWVAYHLEPEQSDLLYYREPGMNYEVIDLRETEDGALEGWLVLRVSKFHEDVEITDAVDEDNIRGGTVLIPVTVREEDGWVVEERGPWRSADIPSGDLYVSDDVLPYERTFTAEGESGTVTVGERTVCSVPAAASSSIWGVGLDEAPFLDVQLNAIQWVYVNYLPAEGTWKTAGYKLASLDTPEETPVYPDAAMTGTYGARGGGDWGYSGMRSEDGSTLVSGGYGYSSSAFADADTLPDRPAGYAVQLYWDGALVEELQLKEADSHGTT